MWTAALERTCFANKIFGPTFDVSSMSLEALERAATAPFRFFRLLTRKERGEDDDEEFEDRMDRLYGEMFGGEMPRYSPMAREKEMTPTRTHKLRLPPLPAELAAALANQPAPPQTPSARKATKKSKASPPAPSKEDELRTDNTYRSLARYPAMRASLSYVLDRWARRTYTQSVRNQTSLHLPSTLVFPRSLLDGLPEKAHLCTSLPRLELVTRSILPNGWSYFDQYGKDLLKVLQVAMGGYTDIIKEASAKASLKL